LLSKISSKKPFGFLYEDAFELLQKKLKNCIPYQNRIRKASHIVIYQNNYFTFQKLGVVVEPKCCSVIPNIPIYIWAHYSL